jgi:hypothetical protein
MTSERYIRASEIGAHAFCARALHLRDSGAPTTLARERDAGTAFHDAHGAHVQSALRTRTFSTWLIIASLALLVVAALLATG